MTRQQRQIALAIQMREQATALDDVATGVAHRPPAALTDRLALKQDASARAVLQSQQKSQQRGFPAAAAADDSGHTAGGKRHADAIDCGQRPVVMGHRLQREHAPLPPTPAPSGAAQSTQSPRARRCQSSIDSSGYAWKH